MSRSRLCRSLIKKIAANVREGSFGVAAALSCRVARPTYYDWMENGRQYVLELERARVGEEDPDTPDMEPEIHLTYDRLCYEFYLAGESGVTL